MFQNALSHNVKSARSLINNFLASFENWLFGFELSSVVPQHIHSLVDHFDFKMDLTLPNAIVLAVHWARISEDFGTIEVYRIVF